MHDIWNPWHGCVKCSEGCAHCYMYYLEKQHQKNGAEIYKSKAGFRYPLQRDRQGHYKVKSGEQLRVCMTSDFFLEEADPWRAEAWDIMRQRKDVKFFLLTRHPQRVAELARLLHLLYLRSKEESKADFPNLTRVFAERKAQACEND